MNYLKNYILKRHTKYSPEFVIRFNRYEITQGIIKSPLTVLISWRIGNKARRMAPVQRPHFKHHCSSGTPRPGGKTNEQKEPLPSSSLKSSGVDNLEHTVLLHGREVKALPSGGRHWGPWPAPALPPSHPYRAFGSSRPLSAITFFLYMMKKLFQVIGCWGSLPIWIQS